MIGLQSAPVPNFQNGLAGIVEVHHRAAVVAEVELAGVFEHRIDLAARHAAEVLAPSGARVIAEDLQRHRRAAIDRAAGPNADHEDHVSRAGVLERALDDLPGPRDRAAKTCRGRKQSPRGRRAA